MIPRFRRVNIVYFVNMFRAQEYELERPFRDSGARALEDPGK
jgi:hypothetical protein